MSCSLRRNCPLTKTTLSLLWKQNFRRKGRLQFTLHIDPSRKDFATLSAISSSSFRWLNASNVDQVSLLSAGSPFTPSKIQRRHRAVLMRLLKMDIDVYIQEQVQHSLSFSEYHIGLQTVKLFSIVIILPSTSLLCTFSPYCSLTQQLNYYNNYYFHVRMKSFSPNYLFIMCILPL